MFAPPKPLRAAAVAAAALIVLGACSNTESPINRTPQSGTATATDVNGVQRITLLVGDDYRFHPSTFYVHPGKVELTLKHTGSGAPHDFEVSAFPGDYVGLVRAGQSVTGTFTTPSPGRYRFVCTIHTRQGMVGTMIVERG